MRHTGRAVAKAGYSDPRAFCGRRRAYRIKVTSGITESSHLSVPSVGAVCYLNLHWGPPVEIPECCPYDMCELKHGSKENIGLITVNPKIYHFRVRIKCYIQK